MKEFEKLKLPDELAEYTGHVMYPDEDTKLWEKEGLLNLYTLLNTLL